MRIVYMGTPDFAVPALEALHREGHEIVYVVTQPDAVRDRGKKVKFSPVKEKALELGLEVLQPQRVKGNEEFIQQLKDAAPDVIAVAAYGQILPKDVLDIPPMGCINIHGSLLPRFRGAAPIQRSIIAGDEETGITIMYMEEGLDTGDMLAKAATPIGKKTGEQLHDELSVMGAELLVETLPKLGKITGEKQNDEESNYAPMISKKEGHIDFSMKAEEIERLLDEFNDRKTKEAIFCYHIDKIECDFQAKLYDLEGVFDIEQAKKDLDYYGEEALKVEKLAKTASDYWIEYDRKLYRDDKIFEDLLNEIKYCKIM